MGAPGIAGASNRVPTWGRLTVFAGRESFSEDSYMPVSEHHEAAPFVCATALGGQESHQCMLQPAHSDSPPRCLSTPAVSLPASLLPGERRAVPSAAPAPIGAIHGAAFCPEGASLCAEARPGSLPVPTAGLVRAQSGLGPLYRASSRARKKEGAARMHGRAAPRVKLGVRGGLGLTVLPPSCRRASPTSGSARWSCPAC